MASDKKIAAFAHADCVPVTLFFPITRNEYCVVPMGTVTEHDVLLGMHETSVQSGAGAVPTVLA